MKSVNEGPKSSARRDLLMDVQNRVQSKWAAEKTYDSDAPAAGTEAYARKEKFMCTFPYPYMNGVLHLGHAFSLSKAEFAARYHRLRGKQVLWPFGFHGTGMPIAACAQKLSDEISQYGNPPVFTSHEVTTPSAELPCDAPSFKGKKG